MFDNLSGYVKFDQNRGLYIARVVNNDNGKYGMAYVGRFESNPEKTALNKATHNLYISYLEASYNM